MRFRRLILILLALVTAVILFTIFSRRATRADFGPAITLCPGPDLYGYTCVGGAGYAYIDATQDTAFYEDDGTTLIEIPFPFTFYGTTYSELNAGSNGVILFGSVNPNFGNECLTEQPTAGMGDMIAPYWDDLDLRFEGFLETETVGEAPNRIFVIEWDDVPRLGDDADDRVTFAVQLFEGNHDILFLYEDVTTFEGHNGGSATIGLQSEANGLALQYSCDQAAIADAGRILFPHPEAPNPDAEPVATAELSAGNEVFIKAPVSELIHSLNRSGPAILSQLDDQWRGQNPARAAVWQWLDMTGDGRDELVLLWYGGPEHPELAQLVILGEDEAGLMGLLLADSLSTRAEPVAELHFVDTVDLTHDGLADILLETDTGQIAIITATTGDITRIVIPERCQGGLVLLDADEDGRLDIVRDGCQTEGRVRLSWNGREFSR